ncbi:MAG: 1-acyl-sn-glycerol-3-phosphate acyltransferase [Rhodospirillaceae bacterium]|nr:MAG: 1-acyl-sn-glycerol-3-phosphate acyltransferase [Rhodospirillaceae bacterium]
MIFLRSALFNLLFFGGTTFLAFACLPILLLPRRYLICLQRFWTGGMAWLLSHVVGITAEIRGREYLPEGAFLVASKHQSAWETMAYVFLLRDPSFVLKREILLIPVFGLYVRKAGLVPIDRTRGVAALRRMLRSAGKAAEEGRPIVIFPEGTRVAPGSHSPYHAGIVALYTHLHLPVVPVALNSGLYWSRRSFLKRPGKIVLEFLPPIPEGLGKSAFLEEVEQRIEGATDRLVAEAEGAA